MLKVLRDLNETPFDGLAFVVDDDSYSLNGPRSLACNMVEQRDTLIHRARVFTFFILKMRMTATRLSHMHTHTI